MAVHAWDHQSLGQHRDMMRPCQVMGVITRKDIAEANAKLALGRKANLGLTTPSDRLVRAGSLPFIPYGAYDPTVGYSSSRCAPAPQQTPLHSLPP